MKEEANNTPLCLRIIEQAQLDCKKREREQEKQAEERRLQEELQEKLAEQRRLQEKLKEKQKAEPDAGSDRMKEEANNSPLCATRSNESKRDQAIAKESEGERRRAVMPDSPVAYIGFFDDNPVKVLGHSTTPCTCRTVFDNDGRYTIERSRYCKRHFRNICGASLAGASSSYVGEAAALGDLVAEAVASIGEIAVLSDLAEALCASVDAAASRSAVASVEEIVVPSASVDEASSGSEADASIHDLEVLVAPLDYFIGDDPLGDNDSDSSHSSPESTVFPHHISDNTIDNNTDRID